MYVTRTSLAPGKGHPFYVLVNKIIKYSGGLWLPLSAG